LDKKREKQEANDPKKHVTNYIIDKIEKTDYEKLSPRCKEVFMIV